MPAFPLLALYSSSSSSYGIPSQRLFLGETTTEWLCLDRQKIILGDFRIKTLFKFS